MTLVETLTMSRDITILSANALYDAAPGKHAIGARSA